MLEGSDTTTERGAQPAPKPHGGIGCFGKVAIVLLVLVLIVAVLWYTWLAGATNRRDAALERLREAGIATNVEELVAQVEPVPDELNPAVEYERAWSLIDEEEAAWEAWYSYDIPEGQRTPEEVEQFTALERAVVKAYQEPIELVAQADGKIRPSVNQVRADFGVWSQRNGRIPADMISVLLPHLNKLRQAARLVGADANVAAAEGNGKRVVRNTIRMIGMVDAIDSDSYTLVEHLVAIGVRAMAAETVIGNAEAAATAPPELKGTLIDLLLDDAPGTAGYRAGMAGEVTMQQALMKELDARHVSLNTFETGATDAVNPLQNLLRPIMRGDAAQMADYMLEAIGAADAGRWPQAAAGMPDKTWMEEMRYTDIFATILLPSLDRAVEAEFRSRTDRRLAATTLAIRSYERDHEGQLPPDLEALAPGYLPRVPIDPMAATGDLKYDPDRALLWSVGADSVDDRGDETVSKGTPHRWNAKDAVIRLKNAQ